MSKHERRTSSAGRNVRSVIHVTAEISRDIEGICRHLEAWSSELWPTSPSRSGDLERASKYLRLIFPPGHPLYRTPWVRRSPASPQAYAVRSAVISSGQGEEDDP